MREKRSEVGSKEAAVLSKVHMRNKRTIAPAGNRTPITSLEGRYSAIIPLALAGYFFRKFMFSLLILNCTAKAVQAKNYKTLSAKIGIREKYLKSKF